MSNCEDLLEQQSTLQQTVAVLKSTLEPFNDVEEVAQILGIPFDQKDSAASSSSAETDYTSNLKV
jgi:hypothetical protein